MASGTVKVKANSGLNVRAQATTNAAAIGLLSNGTQIGYSSEVNGWLKVNHKGRQGYISKKYTVPVGASSSGTSSSTKPASSKTVTTTANSLNVRKGAGTNYGVLGTLSKGSSVSYSSESAGWLKISFKGNVGYISKQYTSASSATSSTPSATTKPAGTTGPAATTKPSGSVNGQPHDYKQAGQPWGPKMYSSVNDRSQTYARSACGPTSMADIVKTRANGSVTPETLGQYAMANGHRTRNSGTGWGFFGAVAAKYGLSCKQTASISELKAGLSSGALAVASMGSGYWTKGGHYICVYKHEGGRIYANDPNSSTRKSQAEGQFAREAKQYWIIK